MYAYQIEYSIRRRKSGEANDTEIGFGSSPSCGQLHMALADVVMAIQHRQWETRPGMPDPEETEPCKLPEWVLEQDSNGRS